MEKEMLNLLKDLADVLEKHKGGLATTMFDDGIYVTVDGAWGKKVNIGWPTEGNVSDLRKIIKYAESSQPIENEDYPTDIGILDF